MQGRSVCADAANGHRTVLELWWHMGTPSHCLPPFHTTTLVGNELDPSDVTWSSLSPRPRVSTWNACPLTALGKVILVQGDSAPSRLLPEALRSHSSSILHPALPDPHTPVITAAGVLHRHPAQEHSRSTVPEDLSRHVPRHRDGGPHSPGRKNTFQRSAEPDTPEHQTYRIN